MLEILNQLPKKSFERIDNFLSYIAIYEDRKRNFALMSLLRQNYKFIRNRIGVEAGAGLGVITEFLLKIGARKIYAVEENRSCYQFLKERFKSNDKVEPINEKIEDFKPNKNIDFLFQELYGPLLLDESLLALKKIKFKPQVVIPNGGLLLIEELKLDQLKDKVLDYNLLKILKGTLITDLFPFFSFNKPTVLGRWNFEDKSDTYVFEYEVKKDSDIIAFGIEILHDGKKIIGTKESSNWPYVFTPVATGKKFRLSFRYRRDYTRVYFRWL